MSKVIENSAATKNPVPCGIGSRGDFVVNDTEETSVTIVIYQSSSCLPFFFSTELDSHKPLSGRIIYRYTYLGHLLVQRNEETCLVPFPTSASSPGAP